MKNLEVEQSERVSMETLGNVVKGVLNNGIIEKTSIHGIEWELVNGTEEDAFDVCQWYIIDEDAAELIMKKDAEQVIYYSEYLDIYAWGVTVYGAPWEDITL